MNIFSFFPASTKFLDFYKIFQSFYLLFVVKILRLLRICLYSKGILFSSKYVLQKLNIFREVYRYLESLFHMICLLKINLQFPQLLSVHLFLFSIFLNFHLFNQARLKDWLNYLQPRFDPKISNIYFVDNMLLKIYHQSKLHCCNQPMHLYSHSASNEPLLCLYKKMVHFMKYLK